jgi:hypothetical protein
MSILITLYYNAIQNKSSIPFLSMHDHLYKHIVKARDHHSTSIFSIYFINKLMVRPIIMQQTVTQRCSLNEARMEPKHRTKTKKLQEEMPRDIRTGNRSGRHDNRIGL